MPNSFIIEHPDNTIRKNYIYQFIQKYASHPIDIHTLDNPTITIADIRTLQITLFRKPFASKNKIAVICGDNLTLEAQQALLKTLEEPPPHNIIIIQTKNSEILLGTILSRCQLFKITNDANQIPVEIDQKLIEFWTDLFKKSLGQRMQLAMQYTTNRDDTLRWITSSILEIRKFMLNILTKEDNLNLFDIKYLILLRRLLTTYELVRQNISLKLVIDNLFLRLPS